MATPEGLATGDDEPIFVAHNHHDPRCGRPPRLRNTDNPWLCYGYFEHRYGEQFVFTFDRATKAGMVSGVDLGWDHPKAFTLPLLDEALRSTRKLGEQVIREGGDEAVGPSRDRRRANAGPPRRPDGRTSSSGCEPAWKLVRS